MSVATSVPDTVIPAESGIHSDAPTRRHSRESGNPVSFARYPKYKDSGVAWLGEVPAHWNAAKLRWLAERYAGGTPSKDREDYWEGGTIPWLNSGAVNDGVITQPSAYITQAAFESSSAKWIPQGALVMALAGQGKTKGMVAQLGLRTTCNQSMAAIVPRKSIEPRFLCWWLQSNYQNIRNLGGGDLRDGLNLEVLGDIPCPLLDTIEQAAIAAFLDHETAKIDALIAEQEKLIALLKEKRQALISHAVTKGLDPNAPMKDSGIEWLGQVPAHWDITAVRRIAIRVDTGGTPAGVAPSDQIDDPAPWFTPGDFSGPVNLTGSARAIPRNTLENGEAKRFPPGSVLIVSIGATLGKVGYAASECSANQQINAVVPSNRLDGCFLTYSFTVQTDQMRFLSNASTIGIMNQEKTKEIMIAVPPYKEQAEICRFLDGRLKQFESLECAVGHTIALLKERRAALISAAVTGKIDVRNA